MCSRWWRVKRMEVEERRRLANVWKQITRRRLFVVSQKSGPYILSLLFLRYLVLILILGFLLVLNLILILPPIFLFLLFFHSRFLHYFYYLCFLSPSPILADIIPSFLHYTLSSAYIRVAVHTTRNRATRIPSPLFYIVIILTIMQSLQSPTKSIVNEIHIYNKEKPKEKKCSVRKKKIFKRYFFFSTCTVICILKYLPVEC